MPQRRIVGWPPCRHAENVHQFGLARRLERQACPDPRSRKDLDRMADDTPTMNRREIERALREPGIAAQCAYPGCPATTDNRLRWSYLADWPGGLPDGYYCPVHRDASEGIAVEGGFDDPEFLGFLPELNKESDRGQVLISCSYLDELLRQTLLAFFIEDDNSNRLVEGFNAALGTFSTRLSAAFALGLISEREFKECNTLRRIRNRFAHHVQASFDMQEIRDLCQNLTYSAQDYGTVTVDIRSRYSTAAIALILNLTNRPHYVSKKRRAFQDWLYSKA
jgi:mannitol operon repressor